MKRTNKMLHAMLLVLCLIFAMTSTVVFAAELPQPEQPQSESETEKETEEIKGFEEPVAYVIKGQKLKLKPVGLKGKLRWKSSRKKVATVNKKGFVTAKKAGKTRITVFEGKERYKCQLVVETPSISNSSIVLQKGDTYKLKVNGTKQEVEWKSNAKKKVSVSKDGEITAKNKGTAIITAQIGKVKYNCKVVVQEPSLSKTSLTLKCGEKETLTVKDNAKKVTWTSLDPDIASVKKGVVTAKKVGSATIQAQVKDKVMTCEVTVKDNPITAVKLSDKELTLNMNEEKVLKAVITPETTNHSKKITWSSSDNSVVKVNKDGKLTAVGTGKATIKAEAGDKSDSCVVTVKPSMSMKYAEIINFIQKNGKTNPEGNLAISTVVGGTTTSVEVSRTTGKLQFGYYFTSNATTIKIMMTVDVPKSTKLNPTIKCTTTSSNTEYQATAETSADKLVKKSNLTWKLFYNTAKVTEGSIQTNCNNRFNAAMIGWQNILKKYMGYDLTELGFVSFK